MTTDTFEAWTDRTIADAAIVALKESEVVVAAEEKPFMPLELARAERDRYIGEVGKVGNDYVYHFFPTGRSFPNNFEDLLGDTFVETFKFQERVQAAFIPEMASWSVRALGFAGNPMTRDAWDNIALGLFDILDKKLE